MRSMDTQYSEPAGERSFTGGSEPAHDENMEISKEEIKRQWRLLEFYELRKAAAEASRAAVEAERAALEEQEDLEALKRRREVARRMRESNENSRAPSREGSVVDFPGHAGSRLVSSSLAPRLPITGLDSRAEDNLSERYFRDQRAESDAHGSVSEAGSRFSLGLPAKSIGRLSLAEEVLMKDNLSRNGGSHSHINRKAAAILKLSVDMKKNRRSVLRYLCGS